MYSPPKWTQRRRSKSTNSCLFGPGTCCVCGPKEKLEKVSFQFQNTPTGASYQSMVLSAAPELLWCATVFAALAFAFAGAGLVACYAEEQRARRRRSRRRARSKRPNDPEWHESRDGQDCSQEATDGIVVGRLRRIEAALTRPVRRRVTRAQNDVSRADESQTSLIQRSQVFVRVPEVPARTYWYAAREIAQLLSDERERRDFLRPKPASWQIDDNTHAEKPLPDLHAWLQRFKQINMARRVKVLKAQRRRQLGRHVVMYESDGRDQYQTVQASTRRMLNFLKRKRHGAEAARTNSG